MTEKVVNSADILGPDGSIARRLAGYEVRQEQLAMAEEIERAVANGNHLIVEAGTGVGKSFAYLVPAILTAQRRRTTGEKKKRKIIVSTQTISLQEQIIQRDIPFLQSVLPVEFSAVLVKGRGNYISLRRTERAASRNLQGALFESEGQRQLSQIQVWAQNTSDGSRADLGFNPLPAVWDEIGSDHGDCLKRRCPHHAECFYYRARNRVWNADLLVVNHALFFSDLALRREGASILPDYDTVILDEAHSVESVAANHMGLSLREGQFNYLLNRLYNDRTQRGILKVHQLNDEQQMVMGIRSACRDFFPSVSSWARQFGQPNGRLDRPVDVLNHVSPRFNDLATRLETHADKLSSEDDQVELQSTAERCRQLADNLLAWCGQDRDDSVFWVEHTGARRTVALMSAPVEVGPLLREHLFNEIPSVILTSATLSVGSDDFSFFRSRVGLTDGSDSRHGSPYDYRRQTQLILSSNMPDPGSQCGRVSGCLRRTYSTAFAGHKRSRIRAFHKLQHAAVLRKSNAELDETESIDSVRSGTRPAAVGNARPISSR